ncbi:hypothetical protein EDB83DRAFT_470496 [Lactarius deliciosus]|nr:hypothetical protein EDB83DRAFT_470496 [Lactarius deliciosus]
MKNTAKSTRSIANDTNPHPSCSLFGRILIQCEVCSPSPCRYRLSSRPGCSGYRFCYAFTNTVVEDVPGYSPDSTDLVPLLKWLDLLDRGWFSVLSMQAWDPVKGEGVDLPQHLLEKIPPATQTDRTRVHSLLVTGTSTLEDWMEGKRGGRARTASYMTCGGWATKVPLMSCFTGRLPDCASSNRTRKMTRKS